MSQVGTAGKNNCEGKDTICHFMNIAVKNVGPSKRSCSEVKVIWSAKLAVPESWRKC